MDVVVCTRNKEISSEKDGENWRREEKHTRNNQTEAGNLLNSSVILSLLRLMNSIVHFCESFAKCVCAHVCYAYCVVNK